MTQAQEAIHVRLLPGAPRVAEAHGAAGAQKDNLCGPYWVATLLTAVGEGAHVVSAEEVAVLARTTLPPGNPSTWLPVGEVSRQDYSVDVPMAAAPATSGTSAQGLIEATDHLSGGAFRLLPIRGTGGRALGEGAIQSLLDLLFDHPSWEAVPILNLRSGRLWGSHPRPEDVLAALYGGEVTAAPPEWDVGHFTTVAGLVSGPVRSMLLIRDTYPSLGWGGYHLQPLPAVAAAIDRGDGREGGCLLFLDAADFLEAERELKERGFDIGPWDNGTPFEREGRN
jgi:hypothetical protein